jgi:hypothetical protein
LNNGKHPRAGLDGSGRVTHQARANAIKGRLPL